MPSIKQHARQTAKRTGLITTGMVACLVGIGFLTLAVWLGLVLIAPAPLAALIIGLLYLGVGLVLFGMGKGWGQSHDHDSDLEQPDMPPLVQALLYGLEAGRNVSRKNKR